MHNAIFRSKMINNDITRTDILSFWLSALFQMPNPSLPYTFDQLPVLPVTSLLPSRDHVTTGYCIQYLSIATPLPLPRYIGEE